MRVPARAVHGSHVPEEVTCLHGYAENHDESPIVPVVFYFARRFRKTTGETATDYRRKRR